MDPIPVVVKPSSITRDNNVMGLLGHVIFRVDQTIDRRFVLVVILLSNTDYENLNKTLKKSVLVTEPGC